MLVKARRFTKGRILSKEEGPKIRSLIRSELEQAARRALGKSLTDCKVGVLASKEVKEKLIKDGYFADGEAGHYFRDDVGSNDMREVEVLAVVGEYPKNIGALQLEAGCLGIDSQEHIQNERDYRLIQASSRGRFSTRAEECVLVVFASAPPPGWTAGEFEVVEVPDLNKERSARREGAAELAETLLEVGVPLTVGLMVEASRWQGASIQKSSGYEILKALRSRPGVEKRQWGGVRGSAILLPRATGEAFEALAFREQLYRYALCLGAGVGTEELRQIDLVGPEFFFAAVIQIALESDSVEAA